MTSLIPITSNCTRSGASPCSCVCAITLLLTLFFPLNQVLSQEVIPETTESIRAQVRSKSRTILAAGITDSIENIHVMPGEFVKKGSLLTSFDCERYLAELDVASAGVAAARARYESAEDLLSFDSIGPLEVQITKSELEKAIGEHKSARADRVACKIFAPYDAIIVKRFAQPHQYINRGEPILELYSPDSLEIHLVVPSVWLKWLGNGQRFSAQMDELDHVLSGTVERLGGVVDPVSQTVEVFGRLERENNKALHQIVIRPGMSGWVSFFNSDAHDE